MSIDNTPLHTSAAGVRYVRVSEVGKAYQAMLDEWIDNAHVPVMYVGSPEPCIKATDWFTFVAHYIRGRDEQYTPSVRERGRS